MDQLHRTLAIAAVAGTLIALAWTAVVLLTGRGGGTRLASFQSAVVGVVAVTAVVGLVLLSTGHAPNDSIHLLYGLLAVAAVPFAVSFGARRTPRAQLGLRLIGLVALGLFILRLFMTG